MKTSLRIPLIILALSPAVLHADDVEDRIDVAERHTRGSQQLADDQDELSADVQQLVIEQTVPKVIELLSEVEGIMDETTDYLGDADTGGVTIAAQTEIIEKIHDAAKEKQKQQGGQGEAGGAMMDMMERMMGKKEGEGEGEGKGKGKKPGDKSGHGQTGESDAANSNEDGAAGNKAEVRRVPKASGQAGKSLPAEFQEALDAYNRGLGKISE